jgi:integrase
MTKPSAANERIKREYFAYLREAHGRDETTIDGIAKSLVRFEESTKARDFKRFHREQAVAFKAKLQETVNVRTGEQLSKATILATVRDLRAFFLWLAREPGYRSHIAFADADYFNVPDKDVAVARARREANPPTVDQVQRVLNSMPAATALERRDRALVAFAAVTGARVGALASFRLGHVNRTGLFVEHDARTVRTKAAKSFRSDFHSVVPGAADIVASWCAELQQDHAWGPNDPLFPQAEMGLDEGGKFAAVGLARRGWATSEPIRAIFRAGFTAAGLPYFNPHSLRGMIVRHYMAMNLTPAQMKAISQSLGHTDVLTTFTSYGQLPTHQQSELIRALDAEHHTARGDALLELESIVSRLRAGR